MVELLGDSIDFSNPETLGRKLKFFKQCKILKVEVIQTKWGKKVFYRFTKEAEEIIFSNNQSKYKKATSMIPDDINEDGDEKTIVTPCDNNIEIAEDLNVDIANYTKETYPQGLNVGIPLDKKVEYTNCITNTDKITTTDIQTEITEFLCEHFGQNNNFTSNFIPTLCKMLESRSSSFILGFLKCCFTTAQAKNNPKAYFYKTAINPSVLNDFEVSYKPPVEEKKSEVKKVRCPICNSEVEPYSDCPICNLPYESFNDEDELYYYSHLLALPEDEKESYNLAYEEIFENFKPTQIKERQNAILDLKMAYGLIMRT